MNKTKTRKMPGVFDVIAPVYDLFYEYQKRNFNTYLDKIDKALELASARTIIDLGCGTGALCSVLYQRGFDVTGVDSSFNMLERAKRKPENQNIRFLLANAQDQLPFLDQSFDIAVTSFVAHGLKPPERQALYAEMKRLARRFVMIYDYNKKRSVMINIAEWLEGGDYFNFIRVAEREMEQAFSEVRVIPASEGSAWYIGKP